MTEHGFHCFGFWVDQVGPEIWVIYKAGPKAACKRRHVERMCLALLREKEWS